ncbi:hypothetical protein NBRC3257_1566 [Gluconobacter thailandicus NBRC 3257]|uniref:Uncharacterized protein n=1 Tax=Gluconobacter thailandicus NBRC 3257 TaxID=1381097 RepID=A0ABQ0IWH5_GLUTH|nr:hypothetical protein [Gluconobacter thailandicus]KXV52702.1 hypothetical protein AD946_11825 [Gluconobacter thailandicus]GAC87898.1 hypothetical protein NBRC3255_1559 [Gluconobacter thailandicus NBRC 3255]GAD26567.1 hypothetical protein NBRC3257_1566 [Gluconobacter thailandicus NBRC 3257]
MSGTASLSSAPLTEGEKMDVRRFCGYPAVGSRETGQESWRFFQVEGALEWRMGNLSGAELQQIRLYLLQLYPLEKALLGASDNLDTAQAASWYHNGHELRDRMTLFTLWRRRLCAFLGVTGGLELQDGRAVVI